MTPEEQVAYEDAVTNIMRGLENLLDLLLVLAGGTDAGTWLQRQLKQVQKAAPKLACKCPQCGAKFERKPTLTEIGAILKATYQTVVHGGKP